MDSNSTSIHIPDYSVNNENYLTFNFSRFILLEELEIGDDSFMYVNEFVIDGLNELKSVIIGMDSFTHLKSSNWDSDRDKANNINRSFHVLNCDKLESIEIGLFSFLDYGGLFELRNLPKLESIKIGEIGSTSSNFYYSSFEIRGRIDIVIANE